MHWKFTELFSIVLRHDKYPPKSVADDLEIPLFSMIPTAATKARMRRLGWLAKPLSDGLLVFAEKTIDADGNESFRGAPASDEEMGFWIILNHPDALAHTQPFEASLPFTSGLSRLFFFDNLAPVSVGTEEYRLTAAPAASANDLAGRVPANFFYKASHAQTKSIEITALSAGTPTAVQHPLHSVSRSVYLPLSEKTYRLTPKPAGPQETIVAVAERTDPKILGIVRIFNTPALPILTTNRTYHISFAKP